MVLGGVESPVRLCKTREELRLLANKSGTVPVKGPIVNRMKGGRRNERRCRSVRSDGGAKGKEGHVDGIH